MHLNAYQKLLFYTKLLTAIGRYYPPLDIPQCLNYPN
jgi:hypothetical protein